ncbi:MAG TPA: hypothetical protein VFQ35_08635 [Polyangiaceae bacterium]|nr:hypothetical protein [Polyangiaceae bacterium]
MSRSDAPVWARTLALSERAAFRLDDVLAEDASFDFARPFLPNALTAVDSLDFLNTRERLLLGHIRAHGYLGLFGIVEEFIVPFVLAQAKPRGADLDALRALVGFAGEETKHIALFRRFLRVFERGFGARPALIGPASDFSSAVLAHSELGVALAILHIEWMTQRHWSDCVRADETLEASFKKLLRAHWMEEAQHARLDAQLVAELVSSATASARSEGVSDYLDILRSMDDALRVQVELDLVSFELASARRLSPEQRAEFLRVQQASQRGCFLLAGITHPEVLIALSGVAPDALERVARAAESFSREQPN